MNDAVRFGAIVLAGGRSTRLGRDKASEILLGRTMVQRAVDRVAALVHEVTIVRAPQQILPDTMTDVPIQVVEDAYPGSGPLGGIYTGLRATRMERCLAVACDMPLLSPGLIAD